MNENEGEMVCPVTNSVLLQPTAVQAPFGTGGSFSVRSSTMDLFAASPSAGIRHIVQECQPLRPRGSCDILWMNGLLSLGAGSFYVRYSPAAGSSVFTETRILYGKSLYGGYERTLVVALASLRGSFGRMPLMEK